MKWKAEKLASNHKYYYIRAYIGEELVWKDYESQIGDYFYFEASVDNEYLNWRSGTVFYTNRRLLEYSFNKVKWYSCAENLDVKLNKGKRIYFRGKISPYTTTQSKKLFTYYHDFNVGGDISTIFAFEDIHDLQNYALNGLFYNQTHLIDASDLLLPAKKVGEYTYQSMFYGCTYLQYPPKIMAEELGRSGFSRMFYNCRKLKETPKLLPLSVSKGGYGSMFRNCTSLTTAPELPATTIDVESYSGMFEGCTALEKVPTVLPFTNIEWGCCYNMFKGCTALKEAPDLPAILSSGQKQMAYEGMFYGCTSLVKAPSVLQATELAADCYEYMFYGCTSLVESPKLLITDESLNDSFISMFEGCSSLNKITCTAPKISYQAKYFENWVNGVASTGTFYKNTNATWETGVNGIPEGWEIIDYTE